MKKINRREAIYRLAGVGIAGIGVFSIKAQQSNIDEIIAQLEPVKLKGNIRHSVSRWCYGDIPLEKLCIAAKKIGIESIELIGPNEWPIVKEYGLTCAMCNGPDSIPFGWNRVEHHQKLIDGFKEFIPIVAKYGFPNIITFSGNRRGMSDEEGIENCVKGLKQIVGVAEKYKVTIVMELLNSKVDHKDYMADHTAWAVEVVKRVGSEYLKLLYDIYHMQIMEGDIIRTIRQNIQYIAHFHTGGVPGRNEIDETQELNYPAIMKAIVAAGYKGFVGQEFVPRNPNKLASLRGAIEICDV